MVGNSSAAIGFLVCSFLCALLSICSAQTLQTPTRVTVEAAFNDDKNDVLYLKAGSKLMLLKNDRELREIEQSIPVPGFTYGAAWHPYVHDSEIFYGDSYGVIGGGHIKGIYKKFRYGRRRSFLRDNQGVDAAGRRGERVYLFKGCKMVIRHSWGRWSKPKSVEKVGLPCHIDAAWKDQDGKGLIILRGDQIWLWKLDGTVDGPNLFSSKYTMTSWVLIPYQGNQIMMLQPN